MTSKQLQRLGFLVAVLAALVLVWAGAGRVLAHDDPPQTELRICGGTLPATSLLSNHDASCFDYTVGAVSTYGADLLNNGDDDTYRHVYFRGGDPACVFTARVHFPNPDEPSWKQTRLLSNVAGGRECNASTPNDTE